MRLIAFMRRASKADRQQMTWGSQAHVARRGESIRKEHGSSSVADGYYGSVLWAAVMDSPLFIGVLNDKQEGRKINLRVARMQRQKLNQLLLENK